MDYHLEYLKMKKKYIEMKREIINNRTNNIQLGGKKPSKKNSKKKISNQNDDALTTENDNFPTLYTGNDNRELSFGDWMMLMRVNDIVYDIARDKGLVRPVKYEYNTSLAPKLVKFDDDYMITDEYIDDITDFFHKKTLKWIKDNHEFSSVKKHLSFIKTAEGYGFLRRILKSFVKENKINWYSLKNKSNYDDVKEHIRIKLKTL